MPGDEVSAGMKAWIGGQADLLSGWWKQLQIFGRHLVVRNQQAKIVIKRDQVPVE